MSRVPLNPTARPVDVFAPQEVRADIGRGDQLMQLASALKSLVPEMAQFSRNYVEMKNIQGMSQAKSDMIKMKIKNQSDLNAAVASGQIKPEDNPWRYNYLNQLAAREGFRGYMMEMTDQYKKDNALNQQEDMGAIESWVESGFEKFSEKMSPSEIEAVFPMMEEFKTKFLSIHKESRDKRRSEKIRSGLMNELISSSDMKSWKGLTINAYNNGVAPEELRQIIFAAAVEKNASEYGGAGDIDTLVDSLNDTMSITDQNGKQIFDDEIVDGVSTGKKITKLERDQLQEAVVKKYIQNENMMAQALAIENKQAVERADARLGKIISSGGSVADAEIAVADLPVTDQARLISAFIGLRSQAGEVAAEEAFGPVIAKIARGEPITNDDKISALMAYSAKESDPDKIVAFMSRLQAAQQFKTADDNSAVYQGAWSNMVSKDESGWKTQEEAYESIVKMFTSGEIAESQFNALMNASGRFYNSQNISGEAMKTVRDTIYEQMNQAFTNSGYFQFPSIWNGNNFAPVATDETKIRMERMQADFAVATDGWLKTNQSGSAEDYYKWAQGWTDSYIKSKNSIPPSEDKTINEQEVDPWAAGVLNPETGSISTSSEMRYSIDNNGTISANVLGKMTPIKDPVIASSMEDFVDRQDSIYRSFNLTGSDEQTRKLKAALLLAASKRFPKEDVPAVREAYLSLVQNPREYLQNKALRESISVDILQSERELDAWNKIVNAIENPPVYWSSKNTPVGVMLFNKSENKWTRFDYWKASNDGKSFNDWVKEQRIIGNEIYYIDYDRLTLDGKLAPPSTVFGGYKQPLSRFPSAEDLELRRANLSKMTERLKALNNNKPDPETFTTTAVEGQ